MRGCNADETTCFRKSLEKNVLERLVNRSVFHFWMCLFKAAAMVHVKPISKHLQYSP